MDDIQHDVNRHRSGPLITAGALMRSDIQTIASIRRPGQRVLASNLSAVNYPSFETPGFVPHRRVNLIVQFDLCGRTRVSCLVAS